LCLYIVIAISSILATQPSHAARVAHLEKFLLVARQNSLVCDNTRKMRVLSWDLGKKNMAYCYINFQDAQTPPEVLRWASIDIAFAGTTMRDFSENLIDYIMENEWMVTEVDVCVMESQSRFAPTLQSLASVIHATLYTLAKLRYSQIRFANVSGSVKFKQFLQADVAEDDSVKQVYTKHKKIGQYLTKAFLRQWGDTETLATFKELKYNRDMSDALCNACAYMKIHHRGDIPPFQGVTDEDRDLKLTRAKK
jgi:hypothetical protein